MEKCEGIYLYSKKGRKREGEKGRSGGGWSERKKKEMERGGLMDSFRGGAVGTGFRHMTLAREVKANARAAVRGFWGTGEGGVAQADSARIGVRLRMANGIHGRVIERCWILRLWYQQYLEDTVDGKIWTTRA